MDFYKRTEAIDITRLLGFFHAEQGRKDDALAVLKNIADVTEIKMNSEMMQQVMDAYEDGQKEYKSGRSLARLIDIYRRAKKDSVESIFRSKEFYWTTVQHTAAAIR